MVDGRLKEDRWQTNLLKSTGPDVEDVLIPG